MSDNKEYQAVIGQVVSNGRHGPYVVSHHETLGVITFALSPDVWKESDRPTGGTYVVLSDLQRKRSGWRAKSARFLRPTDQQPQPATSKKERRQE